MSMRQPGIRSTPWRMSRATTIASNRSAAARLAATAAADVVAAVAAVAAAVDLQLHQSQELATLVTGVNMRATILEALEHTTSTDWLHATVAIRNRAILTSCPGHTTAIARPDTRITATR